GTAKRNGSSTTYASSHVRCPGTHPSSRRRDIMSSLAPALLLSMPQMADPNFARTVVLLCKHNNEGAFGLVMNRPLVTTGRVVVSLDPPVETERELEVWIGGPVEPASSWILVGGQAEKISGWPIVEGLSLSTSPNLLQRLLEPNPPANT